MISSTISIDSPGLSKPRKNREVITLYATRKSKAVSQYAFHKLLIEIINFDVQDLSSSIASSS